MSKPYQLVTAFVLVVFVIVARIAPHPANVAPVAAAALFAGAYLSKRFAFAVPLVAMFVSDLMLGFYEMPVMLAVYGCFAFSALLGVWVRHGFPSLRGDRRATWQSHAIASVVLASLTGSVVFFLVTNFAVWAASAWYPHTVDGLLMNYTLALPFFRNTLFGDLFFTGVFFGAADLLRLHLSGTFRAYKKEPVASV